MNRRHNLFLFFRLATDPDFLTHGVTRLDFRFLVHFRNWFLKCFLLFPWCCICVLALEIEKQLTAEAKKRRGMRTDLVEKFPPSDFGKVREKAAEMVGTNPHYVTNYTHAKTSVS